MVTDTRTLLIEGVKLAQKTFVAARVALGWVVEEMDEFVIHQVSKVHTAAFVKAMGIDPKKVLTIFGEHGNIGPASVPIVLSKLCEMGRLKKGDRVALLGRLGAELLDGRSGLVRPPSAPSDRTSVV